jgi:glycosyltransferase involved in cell wall biosynthesis
MRVLHLTTEFPPLVYGGLGTAVGGLATASAGTGIQVGVLLIRDGGSGYRPRLGIDAWRDPALRPGVEVFVTTWLDAAGDGLKLIGFWRPDVIHLHVFWLWWIARSLRDRTGVPIVYTVHSLDVAEYELGGGPNECLDQWRTQREVLRSAELLMAPSASEADLVALYCPEAAGRIRVAPHGISANEFGATPEVGNEAATAAPDSAVTILFAGRFVDRKGIRELLAAIPDVLAAAPLARFVLAGGHLGATDDQMAAWWPHAVADERVRFTGWMTAEEMHELRRSADIMVVPSWYEPFGMVVLEAMSLGLAIAASNVGGPAEILEHERTALLFAPRDVAWMTATLVRLASDELLRSRLGRAAAAEVAGRWSWDARLPAVRSVYTEAFRDRTG